VSISVIGMAIAVAAMVYVLWSGHRTRVLLRKAEALRGQAQALRARRQR
jgi:hypothetical protein